MMTVWWKRILSVAVCAAGMSLITGTANAQSYGYRHSNHGYVRQPSYSSYSSYYGRGGYGFSYSYGNADGRSYMSYSSAPRIYRYGYVSPRPNYWGPCR